MDGAFCRRRPDTAVCASSIFPICRTIGPGTVIAEPSPIASPAPTITGAASVPIGRPASAHGFTIG